jgi:uncharacterized protein
MENTFQTVRLKVRVSEKAGSVSAEIYQPKNIKAILTIAHGAGTNMDHLFLKDLASGLANRGICTVRYNFLYTELKKKMPDRFPTASAVIRAVIQECQHLFPNYPLYCSGKSFGGRMTSQTVSEGNVNGVKGLIFYGFPLHPAGNPSVDRAEHLKNVTLPMLFLQGTRDALAYADLIASVTSALPQTTLIMLEGADHSFKKGKQTSIAELVEQTLAWVNNHA